MSSILLLGSLMIGLVEANPEKTFILPGGAEIEMVWIEPGTFVMGTTEEQKQAMVSEGTWNDWYWNELPTHEVKLSQGFYLGKYEITQGQWESVTGNRPGSGQSDVQENANNPAGYISWRDMQSFIGVLNETGGAEVYRLPTEAEWEYACRAGTDTRWSFGDDESRLKDYAWYRDNVWNVGEKYVHEVGAREGNPWGLYDMHGNVWEWCWDRHGSYSSGAQVDPVGPSCCSYRVIRGGAFDSPAQLTRSAFRLNSLPGNRNRFKGARLVRMEDESSVTPSTWGQVKSLLE